MTKSEEWPKFPLCDASQVNLDICLDMGGQSFTWIRLSEHCWLNTFCGKPVCILRENDKILFSVENENVSEEVRKSLVDYFRLEDDLAIYYEEWNRDAHFKKLASAFPAIRCLRQDPVETLFAFICSQNNAIPRITKMVQHLKSKYGERVGEYSGQPLYTFPILTKLAAEGVEGELRLAGFGYRAKYIQGAARHLIDSGLDLLSLRTEPYESVHEQLLAIPGVGPKVADCIALMSLDQLGAVPVDTHIWKVACSHYKFSGLPTAKSAMNKKVYTAIGMHFRKVFGPLAGWAHLVLFAAQSRQPRTSK